MYVNTGPFPIELHFEVKINFWFSTFDERRLSDLNEVTMIFLHQREKNLFEHNFEKLEKIKYNYALAENFNRQERPVENILLSYLKFSTSYGRSIDLKFY